MLGYEEGEAWPELLGVLCLPRPQLFPSLDLSRSLFPPPVTLCSLFEPQLFSAWAMGPLTPYICMKALLGAGDGASLSQFSHCSGPKLR